MPKWMLAALALLLASVSAVGGEKQRDWQTGRLVDTDRSRYFAGTYAPPSTNLSVPIYREHQDYVIDAGAYIYVAEERVKRGSTPANVVVNAPIRFAIEKRKLYFVDNDGKEHETQIVKQTLKPDDRKPE